MGCCLKIVIISIMFINRTQLLYQDSCGRSTYFKLLAKNSRADLVAILSDFTQFFSMCAHLCLAHTLCTSFNFHSSKQRCEILSYNHLGSGTKRIVSSPGWKFYQKIKAEAYQQSLQCADWQKLDFVGEGLGCRCLDLANIALRKPTRQSSTCFNGLSERAVDGNTTTMYGRSPYVKGSCTHTCLGIPTWWMVDFGQTALVHSINITSRGGCCGERLLDFNIKIGESNEGHGDKNAMCLSNVGVAKGETKTFKCTSKLKGRYLNIKTNLDDYLTLCEVKVFGEIV